MWEYSGSSGVDAKSNREQKSPCEGAGTPNQEFPEVQRHSGGNGTQVRGDSSYGQFGCGVPRTNRSHILGAPDGAEMIYHPSIVFQVNELRGSTMKGNFVVAPAAALRPLAER